MTAKEAAKKLGVKVDGRWSEKRIQEEIDKVTNVKVEGADVVEKIKSERATEDQEIEEGLSEAYDKFKTVEWAQERVNLIWAGQSPSLSILERTGRIRLALKEKGFTDFDKLTFPHPDCKKYL